MINYKHQKFIYHHVFLLKRPFICLFFTRIYYEKYFKNTSNFSLSSIILLIPKYIETKKTDNENKYKNIVAGKNIKDYVCNTLLIL